MKIGKIYKNIICENNEPKLVRYKWFNQKEMGVMFPSFSYGLTYGVLMDVPLNMIKGLDPKPSGWTSDDGEWDDFTQGNPIPENKPIELWWVYDGVGDVNNPNSYSFMLQNGNHRYWQSVTNGDTHIRALVQPMIDGKINFDKLRYLYGK